MIFTRIFLSLLLSLLFIPLSYAISVRQCDLADFQSIGPTGKVFAGTVNKVNGVEVTLTVTKAVQGPGLVEGKDIVLKFANYAPSAGQFRSIRSGIGEMPAGGFKVGESVIMMVDTNARGETNLICGEQGFFKGYKTATGENVYSNSDQNRVFVKGPYFRTSSDPTIQKMNELGTSALPAEFIFQKIKPGNPGSNNSPNNSPQNPNGGK